MIGIALYMVEAIIGLEERDFCALTLLLVVERRTKKQRLLTED